MRYESMPAYADRKDFRPIALGGPSNLHADIISGRDGKIDIDDIYNGTGLYPVLADYRL